jgi:hypothetical protein
MYKSIEFCPSCNCNRELDISLGRITINDTEGAGHTFLYHYHCASCNSYVRSTTLDYQEYVYPNEYLAIPYPVYIC